MPVFKKHSLLFVFAVFLGLSFSMPEPVMAKSGDKPTSVSSKKAKKTSKKKGTRRKASKVDYQNRYAALVVDADTGRVLYESKAGHTRYPASLTKMMTIYLALDAVKSGKMTMGQELPVSKKAASQPQTNISLNPGDKISVKEAIESLVVRSANDSAMVLAEAIGGTEWNFALLMTNKARELGMDKTVFRNPSGLPDNKQHTTAFDMARLAIALRRDFPEHYSVFKLTSFTFNGVEYPGHNNVVQLYPGADGVKTGYIRASGFNLVTSVQKNGYTLVGVVMGGRTASTRDNEMMQMLDNTFAKLEKDGQQVADNTIIPKKNSILGGFIDTIADATISDAAAAHP